MFRRLLLTVTIGALASAAFACSDDDDKNAAATSPTNTARGAEPAGQTCTAPTQCYAALADAGTDGGGVLGTVTCLSKVENGYCTHTCKDDRECCAVPGECRTGVKQVCASFENQPEQYCFLSCEDEDIQRAIDANKNTAFYDGGVTDAGSVADAYCQSYAGASTSCRSTGGGRANRKVCVPKS